MLSEPNDLAGKQKLDYIISVISEKMLAKSIACGTSFLADLTNYWRMIDMEGFNMDTVR